MIAFLDEFLDEGSTLIGGSKMESSNKLSTTQQKGVSQQESQFPCCIPSSIVTEIYECLEEINDLLYEEDRTHVYVYSLDHGRKRKVQVAGHIRHRTLSRNVLSLKGRRSRRRPSTLPIINEEEYADFETHEEEGSDCDFQQ